MRTRGIATFIAIFGILTMGVAAELRAQVARSAPVSVATDNRITADSPPYRIEWNGASGVFIRKAFAQEPEIRQPMTFLHTDSGPAGFAKYLTWFLARDEHGFSLLWCYLNASGSEFDCWSYRFPSNQLTSLHFTGTYQYAPPAEPAPAVPLGNFKLSTAAPYTGPDFTYRDWTKIVGALPRLDLQAIRKSAAAPSTTEGAAAVKTLTELRIQPLHHVQVGSANGWREGGWNELHALAFDTAEDPYYLILYSNTPKGYAVDLKRSQIYTVDFGATVSFLDGPQPNRGENPLSFDAEPEIKVLRYDRHEIVLTTKEKAVNPYIDMQVGIEFRGPDTKPILVPGFWDGGGVFRVRFAPTLPGRWTWRSLSKIADLNGETGAFQCLNEEEGVKGFVNVQPVHKDPHHFSYANGDPFLPVLMREPAPSFAALPERGKTTSATRGLQLTGIGAEPAQTNTGSFVSFQRFLNAAAQKGFNRLVGGGLLGPASTGLVRSNEGGPAFEGLDLDRINPAYFQWMDRRIAYCNARGVVPDIGIGTLEDALFTTYKPESLYRFWAYIVARYASYDVQWNLFEPGGAPVSDQTQKGAEQFAELTRLYDPNHHMITLVLPGGTAAPTPATPAVPAVAPLDSGAQAPNTGSTVGPGRRGRPGGGRPGGGYPGAGGIDGARPGGANANPPPARTSGGAMAGTVKTRVQSVPYDLPWEDVITVQGGDIGALPWYTWINKPLVLLERPTTSAVTALSPEVTRHRMWEARMRGAYWSPGVVPTADPSALNAPEIQWAAYCADLFRRTRFYRLTPRPEMLGGPSESPADKRRRKKAEAEAAQRNPPPSNDDQSPLDADPFDPDLFIDQPPLPAPKPAPMFVLADPAHEYLVYFEQGGTLLLDLLEATGKVQVTWFNPRSGETSPPKQISGGAYVSFSAPDANDWVLYVSRL